MKYFFVLLLLISSLASADTVIKYGGELPKGNEGLGASKALFIAYQQPLFSSLYEQYQLGAWFDNVGNGRKSSAVASYSWGVNINAGYVFGQASLGPALISSPDTILGGVFQFDNEIAFGLRDPDTLASIGINYVHFSSAGIELPNGGRDFFLFRVAVPW